MSYKKEAARAISFLKEVQMVQADMPAQTLRTFIEVANRPGITMTELARRLGYSQASCSRNVAALGKWHSYNKKGHDLLKAEEDPAERRRKIVKLTPKGELFAEALFKHLTCE
ncbi:MULTISPECIES: MarR family winged helix-turn-helix transcriptional regulator [unclassified Thioalkalivibrio]|uniref:MarR family winged helix-turn-helix transcriptional regulator n=1 Tax=unclassified Thioalkalivibrio TaxID=2621013 RepID=UPI00036ED06A|nr:MULTISPECIES: helix-turn-helix domain-containing protein [unclassified Thioalkalivibrio]